MDKISHETPGDGLLDRTPETDSVYKHFALRTLEACLLNFAILQIFKISVFI